METVTFSQIAAEDINFGEGTFSVTLQDGSVVAVNRVNFDHLEPDLTEGSVLYKGSAVGVSQDNANFFYDSAGTILRVPIVAGGTASGGDFIIQSTTHTIKGDIALNPNGGNVGIGELSPATKLHITAAGPSILRLENDDAGDTGDMAVEFAKNSTVIWVAGVDDTDSDVFKLAESTDLGTTTRLTVRSGSLGVGEDTPLGKLHVKSSDAGGGVSIDAGGDDLVVESSGATGITVVSGNTSTGNVIFADVDSAVQGKIEYDHNASELGLFVGGTQSFTLTADKATLGATTTTLNDGGLTIDQGAHIDQILTFMGDGVAHGMTSIVDTNIYGSVAQDTGNSGGLALKGYSEVVPGITMTGYGGTASTTKSTSATAAVMLVGGLKSGTSVGALGAQANLLAIVDDSNTRVIIDAEGDFHVDVGGDSTTLATYDDYNDVQLLESIKSLMTPDFKTTLGPWVEDNLALLRATGVVSESIESPMLSYKGLSGLLIDAIRQLSSRIDQLEATAR